MNLYSHIHTYGSLVWRSGMKNIYVVSHFYRIQRSGFLGITGALRMSSSEALNTILHPDPIGHFIMAISASSAVKLEI